MNSRNNSKNAFQRSIELIPGGVNSPVRAFGGVDVDPIFIDSAAGSIIRDIDGNEYIDYVCSWGPMVLGHAHPAVIKAVTDTAIKGTSFGAPTEGETKLAERIVQAYDSIDRVRLVTSGTEAAMTAVRLGRGYTGRDIVVKMTGCYHGHSDCMLVQAGSGLAEQGSPSSAGVPQVFAEKTVSLRYNDIVAAEQVFEKYSGQVAAVMLEPVAANMGVVPPVDGYLQAIRDLCDKNDAILIFDEVITGFRLSYGGAQQYYGINADLTCLGKIVGGGLPAAAVGGRKDIMEHLAPLGPVYQAGTLSGNPLATAAANATLKILSEKFCYETLDQSSMLLEEGLKDAAARAGVAVSINRVGSILSVFFTGEPVRNFDDVQKTDIRAFKRYFAEMLNQGIYLAPSAYEAMFVSLAHSKEDIEKTVQSAYNAFMKIR